jgi:U5 small nuclear ribonucleoprotein component
LILLFLAVRLADGVVIVVDVVEGVMMGTERAIRYAVQEKVPITLLLNKIDRLILELKIPPTDAYHKMLHTIEEVNTILDKAGYSKRVSPEFGNVRFFVFLFPFSFLILYCFFNTGCVCLV